ncbi:MAG: hypothetical protein R3F20_04010 [Planctomycetota bacterium]
MAHAPRPDSDLAAVMRAGSLYIHVGTAAAGIVDVRHLVFAGSLTAPPRFWTVRLLESGGGH